MRVMLADADATAALGEILARTRPAHAVVYLHGDLGAGKSTTARAMLRALGVQGPIRSPTYTLIEPYRLAGGDEAVHLDLYRIAASDELEYLGLDELAANAALWLVEWPEQGGNALPQADLRVELEIAGDGRTASITGLTPGGVEWLGRAQEIGKMEHFPAVTSR